MKTLDQHISDAATSKGAPEKNNIIPLHPLSEAQDLSRETAMQLWKDSLELATLERLTREMNEFAQRLILVKSPRLAVFHRSFVELGNTIFKEIIK